MVTFLRKDGGGARRHSVGVSCLTDVDEHDNLETSGWQQASYFEAYSIPTCTTAGEKQAATFSGPEKHTVGFEPLFIPYCTTADEGEDIDFPVPEEEQGFIYDRPHQGQMGQDVQGRLCQRFEPRRGSPDSAKELRL